MYHSQRSPNRRPGRGTQYPPGRPLEMPDPAQTGRTALVAAAGAMREGDGRAARQLLGLAREFFAQTRAEMALTRDRLKLAAETEAAERQALAAHYAAAGMGLEGVELNMQIGEDAAAMRAARAAGKPVPEPRWEESWELAGETMPEGWEEPGCGTN
ncbi:hypothetical protein [Maricaulis sp.]|uniref:hypothetical protein n=1 Tax=Maricaulis sp. TaxID=1486257 RepID=UPI003A8FA2BB